MLEGNAKPPHSRDERLMYTGTYIRASCPLDSFSKKRFHSTGRPFRRNHKAYCHVTPEPAGRRRPDKPRSQFEILNASRALKRASSLPYLKSLHRNSYSGTLQVLQLRILCLRPSGTPIVPAYALAYLAPWSLNAFCLCPTVILDSRVAPLVFLRLAGGGGLVGVVFLAGLALALVLGAGLALGAVVVVAAALAERALTTEVPLEDYTGGAFSSSGSYVDLSLSSSCICRACSSSSMTCCSPS